MASIMRSSSSGGASDNNHHQQRRSRGGGFGRKIPLGKIDVNTPNKKQSAKMDTGTSGKKNRLFSRRGSSSKKLSKSLPDLAYDFGSITATTSEDIDKRKTSVSEPTLLAPYHDEARVDDASTTRRLPSAITTDYYAKAEDLALAQTSSIFRSKSNSSGLDGAGGDGCSMSIPSIGRDNPIFDTERHYTIDFGPDTETEAEEPNDESTTAGVEDTTITTTTTTTTTTTLCGIDRLEVSESFGYVIRPPDTTATKPAAPATPSVDSIFRMVDDAVESVVDCIPCLQRANPILEDDGEDDNKYNEQHDLLAPESNGTMYYQPEEMWTKEHKATIETRDVAVGLGSRLVADEVEGYVIPLPTG